MIRKFWAP
uniref:Uncharacterized protein n=1 Tax=Arundo donax TaxID=35708 RepID=A0A0A9CK02_ARUDO